MTGLFRQQKYHNSAEPKCIGRLEGFGLGPLGLKLLWFKSHSKSSAGMVFPSKYCNYPHLPQSPVQNPRMLVHNPQFQHSRIINLAELHVFHVLLLSRVASVTGIGSLANVSAKKSGRRRKPHHRYCHASAIVLQVYELRRRLRLLLLRR